MSEIHVFVKFEHLFISFLQQSYDFKKFKILQQFVILEMRDNSSKIIII